MMSDIKIEIRVKVNEKTYLRKVEDRNFTQNVLSMIDYTGRDIMKEIKRDFHGHKRK